MPELICFPSCDGRVNLIEEIGFDFHTFGILLLEDNNGSKISAIENEMLNNAEKITYRIFTLWLNGKGKQPVTWSTLVSVLCNTGLKQLAKTIDRVIFNTHLKNKN